MEPYLILLSGLPGTGKSTTASKLEEALGYDVHSLRQVRRDLGHVRYMPQRNAEAMTELDRRVIASLQEGKGAIYDSVLATQYRREILYWIAQGHETEAYLIECICPAEAAKQRIRQRKGAGDGLFQDAKDPRAYDRSLERREAITREELEGQLHVSYVQYYTTQNLVHPVIIRGRASEFFEVLEGILVGTANRSERPSYIQ